jgi:hypothetical protein
MARKVKIMSLDVSLIGAIHTRTPSSGIFIRTNGSQTEISREQWDNLFPGIEPVAIRTYAEETDELYSRNITHNLVEMANKAGIYEALWRPEESNYTKAKDLIEPLETGLAKLRESPYEFMKYNPTNGWGTYEGLIEFVEDYLSACKRYPEATVTVSR